MTRVATFALALVLLVVTMPALAQTPPPASPPPSITPALPPKPLTFALALEAARAALADCEAKSYHVTIIVMDYATLPIVILRGEGGRPHTLDASRMKTYALTSLGPVFGFDTSSALSAHILSSNSSAQLANLPGVLFTAGAVMIKSNNVAVGAIGSAGAPGGANDELCAQAGLAKIQAQLNGS
jgi:uncharacterized protein GlcG (DUF336 family)